MSRQINISRDAAEFAVDVLQAFVDQTPVPGGVSTFHVAEAAIALREAFGMIVPESLREAIELPPLFPGVRLSRWVCNGCGAERREAPVQCACGYIP